MDEKGQVLGGCFALFVVRALANSVQINFVIMQS